MAQGGQAGQAADESEHHDDGRDVHVPNLDGKRHGVIIGQVVSERRVNVVRVNAVTCLRYVI